MKAGVALSILLLLAGCKSQDAAKSGLNCFPKESQKWIWASQGTDAKGAARPNQMVKASAATIYVDRSASMVGYLRGADQFDKPLQDLLGNLPVVIKQAGASSSFRGFGRTVSEPMADGSASFQNTASYSCAKRVNCESAESHLDQVLTSIAANRGEMAIVLSDLWYDNSAEQTSGLTALHEPLTRILQDGRAVMLYGIEAPFDGAVYDIPSGPKDQTSIRFRGKHPLYMLAVGSKADVLEFDRQLANSGSKGIAEGLINKKIQKSLFTVDPGPLSPAAKAPLEKIAHPRVKSTIFESHIGLAIQQFVLTGGLPTKPGAAAVPAPRWTAPKDSDFLPNAVWRGELAASVNLYQRQNDKCLPTSWIKQNPLVDKQRVDGQFVYALNPGKLAGRMGQKGVYMLSGQIERVSVASPNSANDWMRAWSLAPEAAAAAAKKPGALFPTLNLSEVARIMENALAVAAERNGGGIVGFSVLVKAED